MRLKVWEFGGGGEKDLKEKEKECKYLSCGVKF